MASIVATNAIAFVLVLGFLVFAHEAGHFLFAKLFRVRVFVFSFGFGRRLFGFKRGDTDYRVSLIPLGGYVRMAGESEEGEHGGGDEHDFLSKPKWQRFLILFAGPGVNLVIAVLFLTILNMVGLPIRKDSSTVLASVSGKPALAAGLKAGDMITMIDGEPVRRFEDFSLTVTMNPLKPLPLEFVRNGKRVSTTLTPERVVTQDGVIGRAGVSGFMSTEIGTVIAGSAAERAGMKSGDRIVEAAGAPVTQMDDFLTALQKGKGKQLALAVQRGEQRVKMTLPAPRSTREEYPGITAPTIIRKLPVREAFQMSVDQNIKMVKFTFATLGRLFRFQGSVKDFSGPLAIARISGEMMRTGWKELFYLMAMISLQLGIMNLLPIPVLDGGHIMILLIEGIAGRELSSMAKERIQQVGFALIASLMIFVLCNDVVQTFTRMKEH